MARTKPKKRPARPARETQALLRLEMAQPRKAHSVQVKEVQLQVAKAKGRTTARKKRASATAILAVVGRR